MDGAPQCASLDAAATDEEIAHFAEVNEGKRQQEEASHKRWIEIIDNPITKAMG